MSKVIDGKKISGEIKEELKGKIENLKAEGRVPGLAVVLVGDNPASATYVKMKDKTATELGIHSVKKNVEADITQDELLDIIDDLNNDDKIDGILVQLPLPDHIDELAIIEAVDPGKDVDGFHPINTGRLFSGQQDKLRFDPCTPLGIIELIERSGYDIEGKDAVVLGRSNIVGKPVAHLLIEKNATITICHSRTRNLPEKAASADILIAAVGRPEFVTGDMVKEGACVIDVGINRVEGELVGDVDYEAASQKAGAITPVPGGVGPMTIAMLMSNTVKAREHHGV